MAHHSDIFGYEVIATLGYGARSTIFAVKDQKNHVFALKRVKKRRPTDQRFIEQAILEHDVASKLDHENLRKSYKLLKGRQMLRTNEVVVLMEMIDGVTLEHYEVEDMVDLCRVFQQTALGLGAMHEAGYVHADIKPNNIIWTEQGNVKIIDFGQSCKIDTIKERIQGTPDYIAPEQVLRRKITAATDVFNLGATIYWVLTRKHVPTLIPKKGDDVAEQRPCPPPHELNPAVPSALSSLVMQCVQIEPPNRPKSMQDLHDRLELAINQISRRNSADVDSIPPQQKATG